MTPSRLTIRTPSRLHFGLLGWGPGSTRQFGGLGLMIEEPAIELTAEPSARIEVEGPLSERAERLLRTLEDRLASENIPVPPMRLRIRQAPPEHVGLGVGTQLSLAIAAAAYRMAGLPVPPAESLARLTGRGRRSGVGLHGFELGGFIVDGGHKDDSDVPPLIARMAFPMEWSVVVIRPLGRSGLHGTAEIQAFREMPSADDALTERLCRIVLLGVLPAVAAGNLEDFGAGLEELQREVGQVFAPAQGGPFAFPKAPEIIAEAHRAGLVGCGQSSWGPVLYGFSSRSSQEVIRIAQKISDRMRLERNSISVTRASKNGACLSSSFQEKVY